MKTLLSVITFFLWNFLSAQTNDSIAIYASGNYLPTGELITASMLDQQCYLTITDTNLIWHSPSPEDNLEYKIVKKVNKGYMLVSDGIQEFVVNIYESDSQSNEYDFLTGKKIPYYTYITFSQGGNVVERYYCSKIWHVY